MKRIFFCGRNSLRDGAPEMSARDAKLPTTPTHYNVSTMFSRKIRVEYEADGQRHPCPQKWLDSFSMRNFTNASIFDDTLPVADGLMEIGSRVPLNELKEKMEDWFRRKSYLPKGAELLITDCA